MRSLAYEGLVVGKKNSGHYRGWTVSKRTLSRVDCTHACVYVYVCMCVCMCVCTHMHLWCVCVCVCVCVCMYVCTWYIGEHITPQTHARYEGVG